LLVLFHGHNPLFVKLAADFLIERFGIMRLSSTSTRSTHAIRLQIARAHRLFNSREALGCRFVKSLARSVTSRQRLTNDRHTVAHSWFSIAQMMLNSLSFEVVMSCGCILPESLFVRQHAVLGLFHARAETGDQEPNQGERHRK
jgi:hypothetical protein